MQIRDATEAVLDAVAHVQAQTIGASAFYDDALNLDAAYQRLYPRIAGYFARTFHPSQSLPERTLIVAEENDQIIGFIAGHRSRRMGCDGELQWMFVRPAWQRKGVGATLTHRHLPGDESAKIRPSR